MTKPVTKDEGFDQLLLGELEALRSGEERLQRLFPSLRHHPKLQRCFLQELSEIQERAERLDAILNYTNEFWATTACRAQLSTT